MIIATLQTLLLNLNSDLLLVLLSVTSVARLHLFRGRGRVSVRRVEGGGEGGDVYKYTRKQRIKT